MSFPSLKKFILFVAIFLMVPVSLGLAAPSYNPFTDVDSSHPYFKEIMDLYQKGLVAGYDDKTFKPDQLLTRAEFVKLVLGAGQCLDCANPPESIKAEYTAEPFPDVALSAWYFYCVAHGKKIGIVTGYLGQDKQGLFVPDDGISRAESLAVLLRAAGINASDNDPMVFQDVISSAWYRGYLATAVNLGLIDYHNGFMAPEEKISRGEFAHLTDQVMASGQCKVLSSGSSTNGQTSGSLQNISPTSGPVGTVVTASGPNLKDQNQIQFGSETLTPNHPNDSTLTFPVPAGLAPGVYPVSLPAGGSSLSFTITPAGNTNGSPSSNNGNANGAGTGTNNNGNLAGGPGAGNQNNNGSNGPGANGNGNQNGNGSPSTNGNQNGMNGNLNGIPSNSNQNGSPPAAGNQNNNGNGGQPNQNGGTSGGSSNQNNNSFGNQNGNGSNGSGTNTNGNQNTNGTGGQGNQNTNGTSSACPALPPDLTNVTMVNGCPVVAEQRPRDGNPGIFITPPQCNMCPCPNLDYRADIRAGDIIFSVISDVLNQLIYSKSNLYYIKP